MVGKFCLFSFLLLGLGTCSADIYQCDSGYFITSVTLRSGSGLDRLDYFTCSGGTPTVNMYQGGGGGDPHTDTSAGNLGYVGFSAGTDDSDQNCASHLIFKEFSGGGYSGVYGPNVASNTVWDRFCGGDQGRMVGFSVNNHNDLVSNYEFWPICAYSLYQCPPNTFILDVLVHADSRVHQITNILCSSSTVLQNADLLQQVYVGLGLLDTAGSALTASGGYQNKFYSGFRSAYYGDASVTTDSGYLAGLSFKTATTDSTYTATFGDTYHAADLKSQDCPSGQVLTGLYLSTLYDGRVGSQIGKLCGSYCPTEIAHCATYTSTCDQCTSCFSPYSVSTDSTGVTTCKTPAPTPAPTCPRVENCVTYATACSTQCTKCAPGLIVATDTSTGVTVTTCATSPGNNKCPTGSAVLGFALYYGRGIYDIASMICEYFYVIGQDNGGLGNHGSISGGPFKALKSGSWYDNNVPTGVASGLSFQNTFDSTYSQPFGSSAVGVTEKACPDGLYIIGLSWGEVQYGGVFYVARDINPICGTTHLPPWTTPVPTPAPTTAEPTTAAPTTPAPTQPPTSGFCTATKCKNGGSCNLGDTSCTCLSGFSGKTCTTTAAPTPSPTTVPTAAPTPVPTSQPTVTPTTTPTTAGPTAAPTSGFCTATKCKNGGSCNLGDSTCTCLSGFSGKTCTTTASPTPSPTPVPTKTQTTAPTVSATPTSAPTKTPTSAPTATATPTSAPTKAPTSAPTATATPTSAPTKTKSPTSAPTATATPTSSPTKSPTQTPSSTTTPTSVPTAAPSVTVAPTTGFCTATKCKNGGSCNIGDTTCTCLSGFSGKTCTTTASPTSSPT